MTISKMPPWKVMPSTMMRNSPTMIGDDGQADHRRRPTPLMLSVAEL